MYFYLHIFFLFISQYLYIYLIHYLTPLPTLLTYLYRLFDDDETGKISFRNLKRVAKELGENMTDEELQEMIDEADRDGDGEISEDEFLRIMKKTSLY